MTDYMFYRVYSHYKRKRHIPVHMGIYYMIILVSSIFFFIGFVGNQITNGFFTFPDFDKGQLKLFYIVLILLVSFIVTRRYFTKAYIENLEEKYKNDDRNYRIKTWQILWLPAFIFGFTIIVVKALQLLGI